MSKQPDARILPPPYDRVGKHDMRADVSHDDTARFNFLANLNVHLSQGLFPGNRLAYEKRVQPRFNRDQGRDFANRQEIRKEMRKDAHYQTWAAMRRNSMEMRHQVGLSVVLGQINKLNAKANSYNEGKNTLSLNSELEVPGYLAAVDNHCMPGSYYSELMEGDVSTAANYDIGTFVTGAGSMSCQGDGGGRALAKFIKSKFVEFSPKRILDLGCGIGSNVLPIASAFPDAEILAVDIGAPFLRYGHARAQAMGVSNVHFVQMDGESLDFEAKSFDWIQTTMFWHETSVIALRKIMREIFRLLVPGGLTLHLEQPNFEDSTPLYEQFIRDWDAWYNNEPFWSKLHTMDVLDEMEQAGFNRPSFIEERLSPDVEKGVYPPWASTMSRHVAEQNDSRARNKQVTGGGGWYMFGAWK